MLLPDRGIKSVVLGADRQMLLPPSIYLSENVIFGSSWLGDSKGSMADPADAARPPYAAYPSIAGT